MYYLQYDNVYYRIYAFANDDTWIIIIIIIML